MASRSSPDRAHGAALPVAVTAEGRLLLEERVRLLRATVADLGDRVAFTFLADGGSAAAESFTYEELDGRISAESPLGRALLGRHVGEAVEVAVPGGSYRCTILTASRRAAGGVASERPGR